MTLPGHSQLTQMGRAEADAIRLGRLNGQSYRAIGTILDRNESSVRAFALRHNLNRAAEPSELERLKQAAIVATWEAVVMDPSLSVAERVKADERRLKNLEKLEAMEARAAETVASDEPANPVEVGDEDAQLAAFLALLRGEEDDENTADDQNTADNDAGAGDGDPDGYDAVNAQQCVGGAGGTGGMDRLGYTRDSPLEVKSRPGRARNGGLCDDAVYAARRRAAYAETAIGAMADLVVHGRARRRQDPGGG